MAVLMMTSLIWITYLTEARNFSPMKRGAPTRGWMCSVLYPWSNVDKMKLSPIRERAKAEEAPGSAARASVQGAGFEWSTLNSIATEGGSHAVDHRGKVGRRRQ
jgi:hypothetical protein